MEKAIRKVGTYANGQKRITVPKDWDTEYVIVAPIKLPNVFEERKKNVRK